MKFAHRIQQVVPSATLAVTNQAAQLKAAGHDVVSFGAGEPDFPTPPHITSAMCKAAENGATGYSAVHGLPALRDAVAKQFEQIYGQPFKREQILVSSGGKHSLYNAFQVLVDPGDEVIIPAPYWVSYPDQVKLAEGKPVIVPTIPEEGFKIDIAALRAAITPRTVGLVLNSPNNPTGAVLTAENIREVAKVVEEHDLWVITDDIYSFLRYDEGPFANILIERPDLRERIIIVHGASKTYAMTGWRIGFTAAQPALINKMATLQGQSTSNTVTFAQHGAIAAITGDHGFLDEWKAAYDARRRRITELLNAIPGVTCQLPGGAFYAFPDVRPLLGRTFQGQAIGTDLRLAELLLEHALVAVVPGEPFGAPGFVRLSYACSMDDIDKGVGRFAEFVRKLD